MNKLGAPFLAFVDVLGRFVSHVLGLDSSLREVGSGAVLSGGRWLMVVADESFIRLFRPSGTRAFGRLTRGLRPGLTYFAPAGLGCGYALVSTHS